MRDPIGQNTKTETKTPTLNENSKVILKLDKNFETQLGKLALAQLQTCTFLIWIFVCETPSSQWLSCLFAVAQCGKLPFPACERIVADNGNNLELTVGNSELAHFTILSLFLLVSSVDYICIH